MTNSGQFRSLRADQCQRWRQGERIRVETYLEQQPALRNDPDGLLDLIYNEIVLREQLGEPPRLEEYLQRFPEFDTSLRLQFQVHEALEHTHFTPTGPGAPPRPVHATGLNGPTVAGYDIVEEIGRGGMGVVYRAVQVELKRPVALKMILTGAHAGDQERTRFRTEAEAAARLHHPNIVQIYEVGEQDGCLFLALELVDGISLERHFGDRPPPPREAAALVETLARAVHYAHTRGVVHRDLKPANILLAPNPKSETRNPKQSQNSQEETPKPAAVPVSELGASGLGFVSDCGFRVSDLSPKITDFGLAKLLDEDGQRTPSNACLGTPCYMAPEQAEGKSAAIGPATDVYGLGAIFYELLTGRPPFDGDTPLAILEQLHRQEPVPPRDWRASVPRDLETICLKCLEKAPGRRYPGADSLADDLHRFLADEPIQARPATALERMGKWARRRPAVAALVFVLVSVLIGIAAGIGWHQYDRRVAADQAQKRERRAAAEAQRRYQEFVRYRDEALFHGLRGTLFTDAAQSLRAAEGAAQKALDLMGVTIQGDGPPRLAPSLSESQKTEAVAGCYQLLLVLADVGPASRAERRGDLPQVMRDLAAREALAILDRASRLGLTTPAYHWHRARYLDLLGDKERARAERVRAQALQPATALDYFLRGQVWLNQGRAKEACADFLQAQRLQPNDFWPQFFLGLVYLSRHLPDEADWWLTRCVEQRPEFAWSYVKRAQAREEQRRLTLADEDYQTVLRLHPDADVAYVLHVNRGKMRLRHGDLAAAVNDFQEAIALRQDRPEAYLDLARAFERQGRDDEAAWQAELAARRRPPPAQLAEYHAWRSDRLYRDRKYAAAVDAAEITIRADPQYVDGHRLRGRALLRLGRYEEAAEAFDRYLAHGGTPAADIYRERGWARREIGDYPGAIEDFGRALDRQPDAELYAHRGWAYFFADSLPLAMRDFDQAIRLDEKNGDAYVGRGLARVLLGQTGAAVADAEEALRRQPTTPEMVHNIACTFALCADRAGPGDPQAAAYRRRALDAVRKTLDLVPAAERAAFWRHKVFPDKALDPIRDSSDFKELARKYAQ